MPRFLFRTIKKSAELPKNSRERAEAVEILADFYLEWREKLEDYKKLTRFQETDESLFNDQAQSTIVLDYLADAIVRYERNDGTGLISVIRDLVTELRSSDIPGYEGIYLPIIATLRTHMKSFVDAYDRIGYSLGQNPISSEEARHLLEEEIGLTGLEYEEYESESESDEDFAEFGVFAS